jgi:hypothetical protein
MIETYRKTLDVVHSQIIDILENDYADARYNLRKTLEDIEYHHPKARWTRRTK